MVNLRLFFINLIWAHPPFHFNLVDLLVIAMLIMMIGLGIVATLAALAEIFDLKGFTRKRRERERKKSERTQSEWNKILAWLSDALPY